MEYLNRLSKNQSGSKGSFDTHLVNYPPSFDIVSFNFDKPNGILFVEIYPHGSGYDTQIAFSLTKARDGKWFSYFQSQFEDIWHHTISWKPE
jgi:hypothetical protein